MSTGQIASMSHGLEAQARTCIDILRKPDPIRRELHTALELADAVVIEAEHLDDLSVLLLGVGLQERCLEMIKAKSDIDGLQSFISKLNRRSVIPRPTDSWRGIGESIEVSTASNTYSRQRRVRFTDEV
jgi:hypothetical protein